MSSRWLVTGAQGFIGRYVAACILERHSEALVLGLGRSEKSPGFFSHTVSTASGRVPAPVPDQLQVDSESSSRYDYRSVDITDRPALGQLLRDFRPDVVIHLASGLRGDDREKLLHTNVEGTATLVDCLSDYDVPGLTLIFGSSGGVYGNVPPDRLPLREDETGAPIDEYAMSKLSAEHLALEKVRDGAIRLIIARIFNVIGTGQDERHIGGKIAAQMTAIRHGSRAGINLGSLGSTRDFIDVRDVARALVLLAETPAACGPINVASGRELSIARLLDCFFVSAGVTPPVESTPGIATEVVRQVADINRLISFGFQNPISAEDSVAALLNYYEQIWCDGATRH